MPSKPKPRKPSRKPRKPDASKHADESAIIGEAIAVLNIIDALCKMPRSRRKLVKGAIAALYSLRPEWKDAP